MHAYLLVGQGINNYQPSISNLAKKLGAKILDFPIAKVEDTRNLNNLIRLSFDEPTLIVCERINEATEEALNAFLKNLEEPQENIYFALTAPSIRKVLPTIVSRCEIVKSANERMSESANGDEMEKFLKLSVGEKLNYIDKIKDRGEAVEFVENLIDYSHSALHSGRENYSVLARNLEELTNALNNLKANGNVGLQLTNLVVNTV